MNIPSWLEGVLRGAGTVALIAVLGYFGDATHLAFINNTTVVTIITMAALGWEQHIKDSGKGGLFGAVNTKK